MGKEKSYERTLYLFGVGFLILIALAARLFQIQVIDYQKFTKLAAGQHGLALQKNRLRGAICDRNGRLLRGSFQNWYLVVYNINRESSTDYLEKLSFLNPNFISEAEANFGKDYWVYSKPLNQSEINRIIGLKNPNLRIVANQTGRGPTKELAWHLLGTVVGHQARSGLEYTLEPILNDRLSSASIKSLSDATHRSLPGLGLRSVLRPNSNKFFLTIDFPIQTIVEKIIARESFNGAVVVLEVKSGAILAMVSRPMVNLNDLKASLSDTENPFINRAVTAYPPGSVFKSVLLCAGLDSGLVFEEEFLMDRGYLQLGEKSWKCTTSPEEKGHGLINLTEAFAYSCNPVFIELGLRLNPKLILDYAENFGFGRPTNIGLVDEAWGLLPTGIGLSLGERANLALGQQLVSVTPLQVASLIQTIANDGIRLVPYLLMGKTNENGELIKYDPVEPPHRVIRKETARQVQRMMAAVLEYGTGQEAQPLCKAAGKTGTVQNSEGEDLPDHAWFAGYAPFNNPHYVIVVFCEKGISGGKTAAPIFREIMDTITNHTD